MTELPDNVRSALARLSLRARVALAAALAVGLAIALTAGAAYVTVRSALLDEADRSLLVRAERAVSSPLANPDRLITVPSDALGAADV